MSESQLEKFFGILPEPVRDYAKDTIRLRKELETRMVDVLAVSDPDVADAHAEWIRNRVVFITFRWQRLLDLAKRHGIPAVVVMTETAG